MLRCIWCWNKECTHVCAQTHMHPHTHTHPVVISYVWVLIFLCVGSYQTITYLSFWVDLRLFTLHTLTHTHTFKQNQGDGVLPVVSVKMIMEITFIPLALSLPASLISSPVCYFCLLTHLPLWLHPSSFFFQHCFHHLKLFFYFLLFSHRTFSFHLCTFFFFSFPGWCTCRFIKAFCAMFIYKHINTIYY